MSSRPSIDSDLVRELFEQALEVDPSRRRHLFADVEDVGVVNEVQELLEAAGEPLNALDTLDTRTAARLLDEDDTDLTAVTAAGRFEVVRRLAQGGMGVAFLAYDPELERDVVLKVLRPRGGKRTDDERLLTEARATSRLDHPSIATVYDVGRLEDGRPFMALAYYSGQTLAEKLRDGALPPSEALRIAVAVGNALEAAHDAGVIHRDVKPSNIMLLEDGSVRVLDFGIARLVEDETQGVPATVGTRRYMSPERLAGELGDERADIWALAVVVHEMLSGRHPEGARVLAEVPERFRSSLERGLHENPERRFEAVADFVAALERANRWIRSRVAGASLAIAVVSSLVWGLTVWDGGVPPVEGALGPVVAVLPFESPTGDLELDRIGAELAVAISMNLDGVGGLHVLRPGSSFRVVEGSDGVGGAAGEARNAGATVVIDGEVTRLGDELRVAATVWDTVGGVLGTTQLALPEHDLGLLADSSSWSLLSHVWSSTEPPTPSRAGLATRSFSALRSFLAGEVRVAEGRFRDAPDHYQRALEADTSMTLAYWRLWWTRSWHSEPVPQTVIDRAIAGIGDLPRTDSVMIEARLTSTLSDRIEMSRSLAENRPLDWLAWFDYQDVLVHNGGYFGHGLQASREALERLVSLQPDLVRAWDHLFWVAREQRDTIRMREAVERLTELSYDEVSLRERGFNDLDYLRAQLSVATNGVLETGELLQAVELLSGLHGPSGQARLVSNFSSEGFSKAQLQVSTALLELPLSRSLHGAAWFGRSLALATRGRWVEAIDAAERYARESSELGALHALRLVAVGRVVSHLDGVDASRLATMVEGLPGGGDDRVAAEVEWLLGLDAFAGKDPGALRGRAASVLETGAPAAEMLASSLRYLAMGLEGDTASAAAGLTGLLQASSDRGEYLARRDHPFHQGVLRLIAARWHLDVGRPLEARGLLFWHETILPDGAAWLVIRANRVLEPLAHHLASQAELAIGNPEAARRLLDRAEEHFADPDPGVAAILEISDTQASSGRSE